MLINTDNVQAGILELSMARHRTKLFHVHVGRRCLSPAMAVITLNSLTFRKYFHVSHLKSVKVQFDSGLPSHYFNARTVYLFKTILWALLVQWHILLTLSKGNSLSLHRSIYCSFISEDQLMINNIFVPEPFQCIFLN